jgi:hypothetical protein
MTSIWLQLEGRQERKLHHLIERLAGSITPYRFART